MPCTLSSLPAANRTSDDEIARLADADDRVVISKALRVHEAIDAMLVR